MTPKEMKQRTKQFALRVLKLTRALPREEEAQVVWRQLARCATSVAANYRAAQRGRLKAEWRSKMGNVEEEADETLLWLEIIMEDGMLPKHRVEPLHREADELLSIVVASIRNSRGD